MTRDEAIQKVANVSVGTLQSSSLVDALAALGLLKLDTRAEELTRCAAIERLTGSYTAVHFGSDTDMEQSARLSASGAAETIDVLMKFGFKITR